MPTLKEISARKRVAAVALKLKLANRTKNNHEQILQSIQSLSAAQGFAASAPSFGAYKQGKNATIYGDEEVDPNDDTSVISNTSDENLNVPVHTRDMHGFTTSSLHSLHFNDTSEQPIVYGFGSTIDPSITFDLQGTTDHFDLPGATDQLDSVVDNTFNNTELTDADIQFRGRSLKKRQVSHDSDDDEDEEDVKPYRSFMLDAANKVSSTLKTIKSFVSKSGSSAGLGNSGSNFTIKDNQYPDIVAADGRLDVASLHDMHSIDNRSLQSTVRSSTPNRKGGRQSPVNHLQAIQENKQLKPPAQSSAPVLVVKKPEMANQYSVPPKEVTPVGAASKKKPKSKVHDMVNSRNEPTIVEKLDVALNQLLLGPPKKLQPHDPEPWKPPEKHKIFSDEHTIRAVTTSVPEQFQSMHSVAEYQELLSAGHFGDGSNYISNKDSKKQTISNKPAPLVIPGIGGSASKAGDKYDPIFNKNLGNNLDTSNTVISTPTHQNTESFLSKTLNKAASMLSLPTITLHERHYGHGQKVREDEKSHAQSMQELARKVTAMNLLGGYADRHTKAMADTDPGKTPVVYSLKPSAQSSISADFKNQKTAVPLTQRAEPSHANMSHWNSIHSAVEMHNSLNSWHDAAHNAAEPVSASAYEIVANYSKNPNSYQVRTQQARSELWNKLHNRYATNESGMIVQEKRAVEHKEKIVQLHDDIMASYGEELGDWSFQKETDNSDWQEYWDEQAQAIYWYNHSTGEASWTSPALGLGKKSPKNKK